MTVKVGQKLLSFLEAQAGEVILVAPFIKSAALEEVLTVLPGDVGIVVYTRWVPSEVAVGVSDLEVFDIVEARPLGEVRLLRDLHAKTYVRGTGALVGSANVTNAALGWSRAPNVELLVSVARDTKEVNDLLAVLKRRSRPASRAIRQAIKRAADQFREDRGLEALARWRVGDDSRRKSSGNSEERSGSDTEEMSGVWLPRTSEPRRLFDVYAPSSPVRMLASTIEDGKADLQALEVPPGLRREEFVAHIRAMLTQEPVYAIVDDAVAVGEDPADALEAEFALPSTAAGDAWSVLGDWLMYFFPDQYRVDAPESAYRMVRSRTVE